MKAKKLLPVLITLIFTASALCLPQEEKTEFAFAVTQQASCVIKIVTTPDILPWNNIEENIYSILTSSNVGGKVATEILAIVPDHTFWECLNVNMISGPSRYLDVYDAMIVLSIDLDVSGISAPAPGEQFLFTLVEEFRQSLNKSFEDSRKIWTQQLALAYENADAAEARLQRLQAEQANLRAKEGLANLSREAILKDANNIETKIAQEEFNLNSMDWRRDTVLEQIRFFGERISEEINDNIVLNELQNLVDIQTKELEKISELRSKGAGISDDQLIKAEEKLAKAKIELAQKKQQITNSAGGDKIDQLEFQLHNFEINKTETEKKFQYLHDRLARKKALLKQADEYEILSLKVHVAKNALEEALYKVEEVKQQLNTTMEPAVILVGSD